MPKGSDGSSSQVSGGWLADRGAQMKQMITPFSDPAANSRLLALCTAQMLCSVATLIHDTYLPVYLSDVLHLSNSKIGNLQAIAQFLSKASGSVSGTLADILSPARLVIFGTLLTTINKPMFAASGWVFSTFGAAACLYWITFGKIFDRMSKGVREAPSKALIGELAAQSNDSPAAAFSLRQAMATLGALVGAATAALAYNLSGKNYVMTFALASVPATIALVLVSFAFGGSAAVKEAADKQAAKDAAAAAAASTPQEAVVELNFFGKAKALISAFKPAYWQALAVVAILYFARFDASFVTLRAKMVMDKASLPVLTSVIMITQAILSTPAGMRAKRSVKDRNTVIIAGTAVLILANAAFAFLPSYLGMVLGALFIGIHMAMTHGVTIGMLSSYIPSHAVPGLGKVSGTAWSFTDMLLGIILAYSNSLAGRLSDVTVGMGLGNTGCFYGGATACVLSMVALAVFSTFGSLGKEELVVQMGGKKKAA
jgi:MFS family permease